MKFSFIVPYRDRDVQRVSRCLASIAAQTERDFEVIFIDYGTELQTASQVEKCARQYSFLHYTYLNSRGWLWNKAQVLNYGLELAHGSYIIVVDIDLIYPSGFVAYLSAKVTGQNFLQYRCYYLPESFKDYGQLRFDQPYPFVVSDESGTGLLVAPRESVIKIGGFDNYFKVWGFEDMDMHKRLLTFGLTVEWIPIQELTTFHQWHPSSVQVNVMPASWLDMMRLHWESRKVLEANPLRADQLHNIAERPALKVVLQPQEHEQFVFSYPSVRSWVVFFQKFHALRPHQALVVVQSFEEIQSAKGSKLGTLFKKVNYWLERFHISYRMTELLTYRAELITFHPVRDFLFYFINHHSELIEDYYFHSEQQRKITFVVVKK